eukprot:CAMPEP_0179277698 /NCGR_PEP_ID=MMETSP0797-20121207/35228_1 /TAXON_ID=47934 /ORGANISM="Dinophysis acuminata, Strain DAEP01" /LENGTH=319 /DNA_ID=CAMNT_0020986295 /DNA_START=23 /DNA_END=979 /DNA_ORIENTATION=+
MLLLLTLRSFVICAALNVQQPLFREPNDVPDAPHIQMEECKENHDYDRHRPLIKVAEDHTGLDGWCYWGYFGPWTYECAVAQKRQDFDYYMRRISNGGEVLQRGGAPVWLGFKDHKTGTPVSIQTRDHDHPLDDALCYVNGFFDIPLSAVQNYDRLMQMSDDYCKYLRKVVPNYDWISMDDFWYEEFFDDDRLNRIVNNKGLDAIGVNLDDLAKSMLMHEAVKCLMGGAHCDMAYCAGRGCMGPNGKVLYEKECSAHRTRMGAAMASNLTGGGAQRLPLEEQGRDSAAPGGDDSAETQEPHDGAAYAKWYNNPHMPKWW